MTLNQRSGAVAQLVEHQLCTLGVRGSNPLRSTKNFVGESPSGKAPAFGAGIRRFESCLPSQFFGHPVARQRRRNVTASAVGPASPVRTLRWTRKAVHDPDGEAWLACIAEGGQDARMRFYDRCVGRVAALVGARPRRRSADEVIQEVFLMVGRSAARADAERSGVATWRLVMARSRSVDVLRRARRTAAGDSWEDVVVPPTAPDVRSRMPSATRWSTSRRISGRHAPWCTGKACRVRRCCASGCRWAS